MSWVKGMSGWKDKEGWGKRVAGGGGSKRDVKAARRVVDLLLTMPYRDRQTGWTVCAIEGKER